MDEKDYFQEIIEFIKDEKPSKDKLSRMKIKLAGKHKLKRIPTEIEILMNADKKDISFLKKYIYTKPVRTISGVAVVAIMTKPFKCPHGSCTTCPGGPDSFFGSVPQSYTGNEPATMRAIRHGYDPYLQVFNRLEQYVVLGQNPEKVELIIMGGTFPSFPKDYQEEFVYFAFKAMNDFSKLFYKNNMFNINTFREFFMLPGIVNNPKRTDPIRKKLLAIKKKNMRSLEEEQRINETSNIRGVGLTIETRPDYAKKIHADQMLRLGCTRVELGVQSVYDSALEAINRGHDVNESIQSTKILKDLGFKINYHMMLGLPGVSLIKDLHGLKELFNNPVFRPDMLKLYPCMVLKGTKLYDDWVLGNYKPLSTEQAIKLLIEFKKSVPKYVRIMRVQRDIPSKLIQAGVDRTNLRQLADNQNPNKVCQCIRCREIKGEKIKGAVKFDIINYSASDGEEYFISLVNNDNLIGFCRLRFPSQSLRTEITENSALIRELHVYGSALKIGSEGRVQHKGFGKKLLMKAETIAKKNKKDKMVVISGVGVRGYYRKLGYKKQGPYMVKKLI